MVLRAAAKLAPDPTTSASSDDGLAEEWRLCDQDVCYFVSQYCYIKDEVLGTWVRFELWPMQEETLRAISRNQRVIVLKARQLGLTWMVLAYSLWLMLFRPAATALLLSKREDEAKSLLTRLTEMYDRLPLWLQEQGRGVQNENTLVWRLGNGSEARALPSNGGDSYSARVLILDEFDLVDDQSALLRSTEPTIDAGGQLLMISRVDKSRPDTPFKRIFQAAREGENDWHPIFLPWWARPDRTKEWYDTRRRAALARDGHVDDILEQYPADEQEALSHRSSSKRFSGDQLTACFVPLPPVEAHIALPGLICYRHPSPVEEYVIGADPAEGSPTSDPSCAKVKNKWTGEEVAHLSGKFEPVVFAAHLNTLSHYYNDAAVLVERNNHGHLVIQALAEQAGVMLPDGKLLQGKDGKAGWLQTSATKTWMWDNEAEQLRLGTTTIHTKSTYIELGLIDNETQSAPQGLHDDEAVAEALGELARIQSMPAPLPVGVSGDFKIFDPTYKVALTF